MARWFLAACAVVCLGVGTAAQLKLTNATASAAANAVVDLVDAGSGAGTLVIFGAACPSTANDADSGTVLATLVFPDPAFAAASDGVALTSGIVIDASADASGTAQCFRVKDSNGTVIWQGTVTGTGGSGALRLVTTTIVAGQPVALGAFTYRQPLEDAGGGHLITADSCSDADVQDAVDAAVDGDTVAIPAGSCSWSDGIVVPDDIGITIRGAGTPSADPADVGPDASCGATAITITGATAFRATPGYGNATTRVSCMDLADGSGANIAFSVLGTCTSSGCPSIRIDNITFADWAPHASNGISYGIGVVGDVFGVIDHNRIEGVAGEYLQLVQFSHASFLGVGSYGDNSWAQPENYGSDQFLYIENNYFLTAGSTELEGSAGGYTNAGGGRVVVRYNTFAEMDGLNFSMGWHGTESYGRPRGGRAFEYYGNIWTCGSFCGDVAGIRSGAGLLWGNTISHPSGGFNVILGMSTYRSLQNIGGWGACDGASPYDSNDGTTYWSGTISSVSGSNPYTITVTGSPGWSTDQWLSAGSPYSVHDSTIDNGSEITGNGANTLTVNAWTTIPFANGDSVHILRATACLDQAGGRGAGTLYSSDPASPSSSSSQEVSPIYLFANTVNHGSPVFGVEGVRSNTARVIRNRDFYVEQINQAAQSSATSPFDGTTTLGAGHGVIAYRPSTCTAGVSYWATDEGSWNTSGSGGQGRLYLCTSTNTWTLSYTPFTYPHVLVQ